MIWSLGLQKLSPNPSPTLPIFLMPSPPVPTPQPQPGWRLEQAWEGGGDRAWSQGERGKHLITVTQLQLCSPSSPPLPAPHLLRAWQAWGYLGTPTNAATHITPMWNQPSATPSCWECLMPVRTQPPTGVPKPKDLTYPLLLSWVHTQRAGLKSSCFTGCTTTLVPPCSSL